MTWIEVQNENLAGEKFALISKSAAMRNANSEKFQEPSKNIADFSVEFHAENLGIN